MSDKALLFINQFVDNGYTETLTPDVIYMVNKESPSMSFQGKRDENTRMWTINLDVILHQTNVIQNATSALKNHEYTQVIAQVNNVFVSEVIIVSADPTYEGTNIFEIYLIL